MSSENKNFFTKENLDRKAIDACLRLAKHGKVGQYVNLPNKLSFKKERGYVRFVKTALLTKATFSLS